MLFPVGIPYENAKTDTTRNRLGLGFSGDDLSIYYEELEEFPATHIVTENLRLRHDQSLSSSTIKILDKGTEVLIGEWGDTITIDGNSARWAYVYTIDGFSGWCYSGYLKKLEDFL